MADENFAEYPKSLAEVRAEREDNGAYWTPRDALIDLLRQIDLGETKPTSLVLAWEEEGDKKGETFTTWSNACPNGVTALGLLTRAIYRINNRMDG